MDPMVIACLAASAVWLIVAVAFARTALRIPALPPSATTSTATLSVIVAACNEADTIEPALSSLLASNYAELEVWVVNDRSTDRTGAVIDQLVSRHPRAHALHIRELPANWLGKVHAMHRATEVATGQWVLYTDADVVFEPDLLTRAVAYASRHDLDHLSLLPRIGASGWLLDITIVAFAQLFAELGFGWRRRPIGAGVFNLVRREAFDRTAGWQWLRMEIADDTGLAQLVADAGGSSCCLTALDGLSLDWYPDFAAMARGLEKNAGVATSGGHPWRVFALWVATITLTVLPVVGCWLQPNLTGLLLAGPVGLMAATYLLRRRLQMRLGLSILAPLGLVAVLSCAAWSMFQALRKGGIEWRGTFYSLNDLFAGQRVRL